MGQQLGGSWEPDSCGAGGRPLDEGEHRRQARGTEKDHRKTQTDAGSAAGHFTERAAQTDWNGNSLVPAVQKSEARAASHSAKWVHSRNDPPGAV